MPGVSRNGATLTAARWRGFRRADANVISRQIALPVIIGAAALKGVAARAARGCRRRSRRGMAAGAGAAFVSTLASLRLIAMLERSRSLLPYAAYRAALARWRVALRGVPRGASPGDREPPGQTREQPDDARRRRRHRRRRERRSAALVAVLGRDRPGPAAALGPAAPGHYASVLALDERTGDRALHRRRRHEADRRRAGAAASTRSASTASR